ncbi:MAG: type III-A CRISPR-associated RAMP protein Csm5 [Deltaproteobacteria bacterium]|nr:type III-A CRISPR-associated RAMP protein Csm5 [Deltaproteobacteria bacterium]
MNWRSYSISLTPFTPIHIGDGSQLEAYEYAVVGDRYYRVSLDRLMTRLSDKARDDLGRYLERDLVGLRKFVREHFSPELVEYEAAASPRFREVYETKLAQVQNQLIVFPFQRSGGSPLIPGSSLKGALRTAILDNLIAAPIPDRSYADTVEATALDYMGDRRPNIPADPLKGFRVADAALPSGSIIAEQIETKKKEGGRLQDLSMQILREVTGSIATGEEIAIASEIRIYDEFLNGRIARLKQGLGWLAEACNGFYRDKVLVAEETYFRGVPEVEKVYQSLRARIGEGSFVVRLGWGSGLDSISLNLRNQKPRPVKTRKLIGGTFPLGWLLVSYK